MAFPQMIISLLKDVVLKTAYRLELRLVLSSAPACNWSFALFTDGDSGGRCWYKHAHIV